MIWNVCYTIAIVEICLALALFIRQYNRKKDTFSSAVKTLIIGYAMSLFTLLLPIQLDNFGTDAVGVTNAEKLCSDGYQLYAVNRQHRQRAVSRVFRHADGAVLCLPLPYDRIYPVLLLKIPNRRKACMVPFTESVCFFIAERPFAGAREGSFPQPSRVADDLLRRQRPGQGTQRKSDR